MKRHIVTTIQLLCIALLLATALAFINPIQQTNEDVITAKALVQMIAEDKALIIDARPASAYERAHIPNALNIIEGDWEQSLSNILDMWQSDRSIVIYCDSAQCSTSEQIAIRLKSDLAIERIYTLQGGWEAWQKANQ